MKVTSNKRSKKIMLNNQWFFFLFEYDFTKVLNKIYENFMLLSFFYQIYEQHFRDVLFHVLC